MTKKRRMIAIIVGVAAATLFATTAVLPSFLHARMSDGRQPGERTVRLLTTAEITYETSYPDQGYAPNLAALGPDRAKANNTNCQPSVSHACLLDAKLGCITGIATPWCIRGSYRYSIQSTSAKPPYGDYWITATPIKGGTENKNYCAAADAVLRSEEAKPLTRPYTLAECLALKVDSSSTSAPTTSN